MSFVNTRVTRGYDLEAISVWLESAVPAPPRGAPDPRAYIAELEAEVAFARRAAVGVLADRLAAVLARVESEVGPHSDGSCGAGSAGRDGEQGPSRAV